MPNRLARPLEALASHYDAVVIGSGYGGGVAAMRLALAGKRVAVLERGREFLPGEFPSRFPELRKELRVTGKRMRSGAETALYDVRVGEDMHVLVGSGLGGGSLVNAGVALRPEARVFADPIWPGQIRQDGTLDEGYRRAGHWLRPASDPNAAQRTKFQALAAASRAVGTAPVAPAITVSFTDTVNRGRAGAAGLHGVRGLLWRLQCRRQDDRGGDLSRGRRAAWGRDLHARQGAPRVQARRRAMAGACPAARRGQRQAGRSDRHG